MTPQMRFPQSNGIYLVSDIKATGPAAFEQRLVWAMQAGIQALQLRERAMDDRSYIELAQRLTAQRPPEVSIILNRRIHLVEPLQVEGCQYGANADEHLGCMRLDTVQRRLIGISCHSETDIRLAAENGADFCTIGPLFPTPSKPFQSHFITPRQIADWQQRYPIPLFPLGGIGIEQLPALRAVGLKRVAAIRLLLDCESAISMRDRVQQVHETLEIV